MQGKTSVVDPYVPILFLDPASKKKTDQKPEILHTFCFSGHLDPYCKAPGRSISSFFLQNLTSLFREDTHKFFFYFLVVGLKTPRLIA